MHHCWSTFSFTPRPHPHSVPEAGWMDRQATDHRLFVPVCWFNLSRQKMLPKSQITPRWLGGPLWFVPPDYMKWRDLHGPQDDGNCHPGDGKSTSANLWHISVNCHFLQSHNVRVSYSLVSCVVSPCRLSEWKSPDYHWVWEREWHQFYLTCLKAFAS